MAKKPKAAPFDPAALRAKLKLNQQEFWGLLGVTQSGGSRYESGRTIPAPTRKLYELVYEGTTENALRKLTNLREAAKGAPLSN
jgi:DNA-binding transcriptional regulator YiaG